MWDETKKRILYFDEVLDLSRYEFRLLKAFIERPGQVFSRDQLMGKGPGMNPKRVWTGQWMLTSKI